MARSLMFWCVAAACFPISSGCGPGSPTPYAPPSYQQVSIGELAATYRANPADRIYIGVGIKCRLPPRSYRLVGTLIEAHFANPGRPGEVAFLCPAPPADDSKELVISGVCRGIVRDGIVREPGVDYYVLVDSCSVTVTDGPPVGVDRP